VITVRFWLISLRIDEGHVRMGRCDGSYFRCFSCDGLGRPFRCDACPKEASAKPATPNTSQFLWSFSLHPTHSRTRFSCSNQLQQFDAATFAAIRLLCGVRLLDRALIGHVSRHLPQNTRCRHEALQVLPTGYRTRPDPDVHPPSPLSILIS
jgi:hypothetical protein